MGGAPVPSAVAERATDLGISLIRAYGSTEHPSTTASMHSDPVEKRIYTDGRIISGSELRLLDAEGRPVAVGEPGEIRSRGPELFAGYTDPALTADAIDAAGWYDTGDIGILDEDGYLTITDRKKDIIIRGGENVSSAEVENVLAGDGRRGGGGRRGGTRCPLRRARGRHGAAVAGGRRLRASSRRSGTSKRAAWRARSGRRSCASSRSFRARPPERSRRTCCAPHWRRATSRTCRSRSTGRAVGTRRSDPGGVRGPVVRKLGRC